MKRLGTLCLTAMIAGCAHSPSVPQVTLLSAGAVAPGLDAALALFEKEAGSKPAVIYNTAPQVRERIEKKGEKYDLVVVTPQAMDALAKAGFVGAERVMLGTVGQGIAVREGASLPDLSSLEAMKRALLGADHVVFNRATGGQYIESMLKKIGIYADLEKKIVRYPGAHEVMDHLAKGNGREIGFAPIPEIGQFKDKGVRYAGPLPSEVQQRSVYVASPMSGAANADAAAALLRFLGTSAAKSVLAAGGVE